MPDDKTLGTHLTGKWMGSRDDLYVANKRKNSCPFQESNPGRSACGLVTILTELHRLHTLWPIQYCLITLLGFIICHFHVIKWRNKIDEHTPPMEEMRITYRILAGKPQQKTPIGRPKSRCEGTIKNSVSVWSTDNWINVVFNGSVNVVKELSIYKTVGPNFLTS